MTIVQSTPKTRKKIINDLDNHISNDNVSQIDVT